jgi:hypothetical protein
VQALKAARVVSGLIPADGDAGWHGLGGLPGGRVKRRPVADGGFEVARNASTRALGGEGLAVLPAADGPADLVPAAGEIPRLFNKHLDHVEPA